MTSADPSSRRRSQICHTIRLRYLRFLRLRSVYSVRDPSCDSAIPPVVNTFGVPRHNVGRLCPGLAIALTIVFHWSLWSSRITSMRSRDQDTSTNTSDASALTMVCLSPSWLPRDWRTGADSTRESIPIACVVCQPDPRFVNEPDMTLPVTHHTWSPANGRDWLVRFWHLDGKYVGIALPFGLVLFILFYFDANVSSLIAQGAEYPLKKPAGFHWDFFLLGCTTFVAGLVGIPAPNGLIPQAPLHTSSLVVMGYESESSASSTTVAPETGDDDQAVEMASMEDGNGPLRRTLSSRQKKRKSLERAAKEREKEVHEKALPQREVPVAVVEQRVSNLAQGSLCK